MLLCICLTEYGTYSTCIHMCVSLVKNAYVCVCVCVCVLYDFCVRACVCIHT